LLVWIVIARLGIECIGPIYYRETGSWPVAGQRYCITDTPATGSYTIWSAVIGPLVDHIIIGITHFKNYPVD